MRAFCFKHQRVCEVAAGGLCLLSLDEKTAGAFRYEFPDAEGEALEPMGGSCEVCLQPTVRGELCPKHRRQFTDEYDKAMERQ